MQSTQGCASTMSATSGKPVSGGPPFMSADKNSGGVLPSSFTAAKYSLMPAKRNSSKSPVSEVMTKGLRTPTDRRKLAVVKEALIIMCSFSSPVRVPKSRPRFSSSCTKRCRLLLELFVMNITRLSSRNKWLIVATDLFVSSSGMPQITPSQSNMYVSKERNSLSVGSGGKSSRANSPLRRIEEVPVRASQRKAGRHQAEGRPP
mmetsp:Transcript_31158/g.72336  ORF Transcript_31158/g.72336 Transcript_31158/m.72336 type:complete len:204 (-) Transcript_31158:154-765(-)